VQLVPAIAIFYERLADKREELGEDLLADLQGAVALYPENAVLRMRLGMRAEMDGDLPLAEESLLAAASRSQLYQPRYLLAQYYFRRQNAESFWKWLRSALEIAHGDIAALLDLGWHMQPDSAWIWQHAIPARPEITRQFLVFLAGKRQWETARSLADRIAGTATVADRPILLDYCERRLITGNRLDAMGVWNTLCRRGLLAYQPLDLVAGPYLTGSGFDRTPLETGFDWRFNNPPGVQCTLRDHEIRLRFSGSQPEQCTILWQYIPVEAARLYRLAFGIRTIDAAKGDGVGWSVSELAGTELGNGLTPSGAVQFHSAQNSLLKLALVYRRPLGSTRLEGALAISKLSLDRLP
jgi:hypothetical protein